MQPPPPTNQVNRRSKTQAPALCGPPLLIKSKPDGETHSVTPVRGPRSEATGPWSFKLGPWASELGPRTTELGSGKVAGKVLIVDHM